MYVWANNPDRPLILLLSKAATQPIYFPANKAATYGPLANELAHFVTGPTSHCCNNPTGCTLFWPVSIHRYILKLWDSFVLGSWFKSLYLWLLLYYAITQRDCEGTVARQSGNIPINPPDFITFSPASAWLCTSPSIGWNIGSPILIIMPLWLLFYHSCKTVRTQRPPDTGWFGGQKSFANSFGIFTFR